MKRKRECKYNMQWENTYSWLESIKEDDGMVFCKPCRTKISISNMGSSALERHQQTTQHKDAFRIWETSNSVWDIFKNNTIVKEVEIAETILAFFLESILFHIWLWIVYQCC